MMTRHKRKRAPFDLILVILAMASGAGIGVAAGVLIENATPEIFVLLASVGGILGTISGFAALRLARVFTERERRTPSQSRIRRLFMFFVSQVDRRIRLPRRKRTEKPGTSKPIHQRIAQFSGINKQDSGNDEQDIVQQERPFVSKMPFRSAVKNAVRFPPKSAAAIRRSLSRIRWALRIKKVKTGRRWQKD